MTEYKKKESKRKGKKCKKILDAVNFCRSETDAKLRKS